MKRFPLVAAIALAAVLGSFQNASSLMTNGQTTTTTTKTHGTQCVDTPITVKQPTGRMLCSVESTRNDQSDDFVGSNDCKAETIDVASTKTECIGTVTTTLSTYVAVCGSGSSNGSGAQSCRRVLQSQMSTCVTDKGTKC